MYDCEKLSHLVEGGAYLLAYDVYVTNIPHGGVVSVNFHLQLGLSPIDPSLYFLCLLSQKFTLTVSSPSPAVN